MKSVFILLLVLLTIQSCSNADDLSMMEENQMMMDDDPTSTTFTGDFVSSAHPTSGKASINKEKTVLTFTNFKTDNGPVLEVYLTTDTSVLNYISLGALKGVNGNYEYTLPSNINYSVYNHIVIWCVDFKVNFGYAILK
jgi:hypothetical protein